MLFQQESCGSFEPNLFVDFDWSIVSLILNEKYEQKNSLPITTSYEFFHSRTNISFWHDHEDQDTDDDNPRLFFGPFYFFCFCFVFCFFIIIFFFFLFFSFFSTFLLLSGIQIDHLRFMLLRSERCFDDAYPYDYRTVITVLHHPQLSLWSDMYPWMDVHGKPLHATSRASHLRHAHSRTTDQRPKCARHEVH